MGAMASQITSLTIVYSVIYTGADQRKHQSSVSLAFVRGIHRWPVTQKIFPFNDVIMNNPEVIIHITWHHISPGIIELSQVHFEVGSRHQSSLKPD